MTSTSERSETRVIDPTLPPADPERFEVFAARLEAKLDVALAQHGAQLHDHERRLGKVDQTLVDHDTRITANALTIAETRALVRTVDQAQAGSRNAIPVWVGIAIGALGMVLGPILTVLLSK